MSEMKRYVPSTSEVEREGRITGGRRCSEKRQVDGESEM